VHTVLGNLEKAWKKTITPGNPFVLGILKYAWNFNTYREKIAFCVLFVMFVVDFFPTWQHQKSEIAQ
jgi:hypothetical protein